MSDLVYLRPQIHSDVPAFVVGSFFAYEDLLGAFAAVVAVKPPWSGPPLNAVALTNERLIAFDIHAATESTFVLPLNAVVGISPLEEAQAGRVRCIAAQQEMQLTELLPAHARFIQEIVYHAAAGRIYRLRSSDQAAGPA